MGGQPLCTNQAQFQGAGGTEGEVAIPGVPERASVPRALMAKCQQGQCDLEVGSMALTPRSTSQSLHFPAAWP